MEMGTIKTRSISSEYLANVFVLGQIRNTIAVDHDSWTMPKLRCCMAFVQRIIPFPIEFIDPNGCVHILAHVHATHEYTHSNTYRLSVKSFGAKIVCCFGNGIYSNRKIFLQISFGGGWVMRAVRHTLDSTDTSVSSLHVVLLPIRHPYRKYSTWMDRTAMNLFIYDPRQPSI